MGFSYLQPAGEPWYLRFHDLMPFRVREILLVSSPYDAFTLEEDGRLSARLFIEYSELNLSQAPRITHASSASRAMELLSERWFDLVMTMVHLQDVDVRSFARQVKAQFPGKPVVLLTFQEAELRYYSESTDQSIDQVFLWTGDTQILVAAIKLIEDHRNVAHDTRTAGVRVVIVVEDSVRRYSSFLSLLYAELLSQAGSLIAEGGNDLHKLLRMRARPKILLATSFEEAMRFYGEYRPYVFAVISDVRFPHGGREDPEAGFELARIVRSEDAALPVLLQSAEPDLAERATTLGVNYADKNSPQLMRQVRDFLVEGLGFGDFVFRLPDRTEVARARDTYEMEEVLQRVPAESLEYHAARNHFSLWLMARSMFRLGGHLRRQAIGDCGGVEGVRQHLIQVLRRARQQDQEGAIIDFAARQSDSHFMRMGRGSMGGKGRSIAFVNTLLVRHGLLDRFDGLQLRIPQTVALGTDEFDRFLEHSGLSEWVPSAESDEQILWSFLEARLPDETQHDLEAACRELTGPIAVRSSSLLEDSHLRPFAGIYSTYMLPNNHPDPHVRQTELCRAVKAVYASTFYQRARAYLAGTPYSLEDEKMGVLIQQMVGQRYGERFYPDFSGVACSYNYYPFGAVQPEEGIAALAVGLGHQVVTGGAALQFCPAAPHVLPQFPTPEAFLRHSQRQFFAVDLSRVIVDFFAGDESSLRVHPLGVAEADGMLRSTGSVYIASDNAVRDNLNLAGPRVVTFNNILKWESVPLAEALNQLLAIAREGIGHAVEIEFAVDMGDWGRSGPSDAARRSPCLYLLQVRPQAVSLGESVPAIDEVDAERTLCRTDTALGHGVTRDIEHVVYVKSEALALVSTKEAAAEVARVNATLAAASRPYLLVGPGRWGSSDPRLGIPVQWTQISGAKVIVETDFAGRSVEPSQGSHFFHNITAMGIGYLTLKPEQAGGGFDRPWLDAQPASYEGSAVRHVTLERPLVVCIDGRRGQAVVLKCDDDASP